MTVKKILTAILSAVFFSGCMYQADLRPADDENLIWVCEEPYAIYEYNKHAARPIGKIVYGETEYDVVYGADYGPYMYVMSSEELKPENEDAYWDDFIMLDGRAEYKRDGFDFQIKEDYVNMFNGELPLLKFKCYKKADYFKEKQDE